MGLFSWLSPSRVDENGDANAIPTKTQCFYIEGFLTCSYFTNAVRVADMLTANYPHIKVDVSAYVKEQWKERAEELQQEFATDHKTSPFIYEGCSTENQTLIGGYTDFAKRVKETYRLNNIPLD
ncbi:hypothetical protein BDF20DRAFT_915762 [Mycotypha africana]|uniref:uncharacterized protein n=1 Tax=Mycotypha africana TaxID=64632 RepID=UPI0022FFF8FA|nr:uncharacterized protein BDF20DRAFT_915762 [Mycotypha africana]KAI8972024.1 hypothetical protein BDF20DRAFT_915762 [Mycotypha africana]